MKLTPDSPPKSSSPYRGVLWLIAFAALLVLLIQGGRLFVSIAQRADVKRNATLPVAASLPAAVDTTTAPKTIIDRRNLPFYLTDESILKSASDSQTLGDYPFYHLLYQMSVADVGELAKKAVPNLLPAEMSKLDPGAPVSIEGTLRFVHVRRELGIPDVGIAAANQFEVEDPKGNLYLVYSVHRTAGVGDGDRVKVVGRYLRHYPHVPIDKETESPEALTPVIVAQGFDGSAVLSDPKAIHETTDGADGTEAKPFYYLLNKITRMTQEAIQEQARKDLNELKKQGVELTPAQMRKTPDLLRGRFAAVEGTLLLIQRMDEPPNILGIEHTYYCVLHTRDGDWVWVYTLEEPVDFKKRDQVKVYGPFVKWRIYPDQRKFVQNAVVMVARRLVPVEYKETQHLVWVVVAIAAATAVALAAGTAIDRRKRRQFDRHIRQLAAKTRPANLNEVARARAARIRRHESTPAATQPPPPAKADDAPTLEPADDKPPEPGNAGKPDTRDA